MAVLVISLAVALALVVWGIGPHLCRAAIWNLLRIARIRLQYWVACREADIEAARVAAQPAPKPEADDATKQGEWEGREEVLKAS